MENFKKSSELKKIKRLSIIPFLINICLMVILLSQKWWGFLSSPVEILISVCILLNLIFLFYLLRKKIERQKIEGQKTYNPTKFKQVISIIGIIIVAIIGIILVLLIPELLKK